MNKGIENEFLEFYDKSAADILRHIYFRVSDEALAEDLTSETFMKAWRYIGEGGRIDNIKSFIYKVANNLVIDYYRSKKPSLALDEAIALPDHKQNGIHAAIDADIEMEVVRRNLSSIPKTYRDVIILRFIDELDIKEIKTLTGKSSSNIYVLIHRGLKMLKTRIDKEKKEKNNAL